MTHSPRKQKNIENVNKCLDSLGSIDAQIDTVLAQGYAKIDNRNDVTVMSDEDRKKVKEAKQLLGNIAYRLSSYSY